MEKLYNGIIIPEQWPPKYTFENPEEPIPIPYLVNRPKVIPVDIGRQLFVDDFLIENTTLSPVYHQAVKYEGNPVFYADTPWEKGDYTAGGCPKSGGDLKPPVHIATATYDVAGACPKSGGVWWDRDEKIYKMWYEAGMLNQMAYAVSHDGIHWQRPGLDVEPGTNKILTYCFNDRNILMIDEKNPLFFRPDSTAVFIDYDCTDKSQRYKMFLRNPGLKFPGIAMTSADGIHWENFTLTSPVWDRSTIFYNPFRKKWIYSIRDMWHMRSRSYRECDDYLSGATWSEDEAVKWLCADSLDIPNPYIDFKPQLYNVDAVGYESIMLGMFQVMYGPENNFCEPKGIPKITELIPMYSRDGFHFSRPCRTSLIPASYTRGSWDRGYIQSVGGVCIVHRDELWFYYAGFSGDEQDTGGDWRMYTGGAMGIAKLRRDGFVSMSAGKGQGELLTRQLTLEQTTKDFFYVNVNGSISVRILSVNGGVLAQSETVEADGTKVLVPFRDGFRTSSLAGKVFRIEFKVGKGELYSFWFSADESGESGGFHAAGCPC